MSKIPRQQIQFCKSFDGARIAYAKSGDGPPLVRVGGWMSHLEFDWGSPVWRHWLSELTRHHRLVRYDARGCGLSDWEPPELSFESWVRDLEAVIDAAQVEERFALFGISQGAAVAIAYAARHPGRVSHIVLFNGYARGRLKRGGSAEQHTMGETMATLAELGWGGENPAFRQFFTTQFIPDGSPEQHRWFNELEKASTSPANAGRIIRVLNSIDVVEEAKTVSAPTLVLHSTRDARVPFDEGRRIASLIPGAQLVPIESRNHVLLEDEPGWARWVEEVRAFLPGPVTGGPVFDALTPRERELVELIARGLDNAQIAARLDLSEKTVRNHITRIFDKLEVDNRARAIVLAREAGFGGQKP